MLPSRKFWKALGFETSGNDDNFTVEIPGWAWALSLIIVLLMLRATIYMVFR